MEQMEVEPALNSSSDENDSDSSDDEEKQTLKVIEELERQLSENKYLYDVHVELVRLYHQLGDLKSMRAAYERFHEFYPLTTELWLAWINAEKKIATSDKDVEHIMKLFDMAVEDYASVPLWQEYAQYSIGVSDLPTTRAILERGLTVVGLHAAEGILLWDTLRELELAHLSLTAEGTEEWKEAVNRVANVFRRQLSVPLIGMENVYAEWKEWLGGLAEGHGVDPKPVEWGYEKALKILEKYKPFEDKLLTTKDEKELYDIYKDYLKCVDDPSTAVCIYERAAAQLCLDPNVWLDYCVFVMKLGDLADKVSKRALRNCPWSEDLWIMRLRILEHLGRDNKEVMACFEQGISVMVHSGLGLELWLAYLEYANRTGGKDDDSRKKLYKLFDQAIEQLGHNTSDKVAKWYARILAKDGDMAAARRVWKNILKGRQNKSSAAVWLEFANLERQYGDVAQLRGIFQRALHACTDWPQYIADEWLMVEREFGTLDDVIRCTETCKKVLIKVRKQQQAAEVSADDKATEADPKGTKRKHDGAHGQTESKKSRTSENTSHRPPIIPTKKQPIVKDPTTTVFISNLYPSINEKRLKKVFPNAVNIELVRDRQGKSRCYGYVQFEKEEEVSHALARDREPIDGRPVFVSNCKADRTERKATFKYSQTPESNKLFVRGLPIDKTQEDVEQIFKPYNCKEVRLVLHKSGQSKGLAYVEFPDQESAKEALKHTDQMKIGDHVISVAISAPPPKAAAAAAQRSRSSDRKIFSKSQKDQQHEPQPSRHARSRLQVPMLPRALQIAKNTEPSTASNGKESGSEGPSQEKKKTNEDFRKMLLNK